MGSRKKLRDRSKVPRETKQKKNLVIHPRGYSARASVRDTLYIYIYIYIQLMGVSIRARSCIPLVRTRPLLIHREEIKVLRIRSASAIISSLRANSVDKSIHLRAMHSLTLSLFLPEEIHIASSEEKEKKRRRKVESIEFAFHLRIFQRDASLDIGFVAFICKHER